MNKLLFKHPLEPLSGIGIVVIVVELGVFCESFCGVGIDSDAQSDPVAFDAGELRNKLADTSAVNGEDDCLSAVTSGEHLPDDPAAFVEFEAQVADIGISGTGDDFAIQEIFAAEALIGVDPYTSAVGHLYFALKLGGARILHGAEHSDYKAGLIILAHGIFTYAARLHRFAELFTSAGKKQQANRRDHHKKLLQHTGIFSFFIIRHRSCGTFSLLIFLFQCILYYTLIAKYSSQNREIMLNYIALSRALDKNIRYLVIGDPVSHSRSPGLQNAAFEAAGLGRPYARMQVDAKDMAEFVDFARKHLLGVNLTVPHKNIIVPFCDTISPEAQICGSVNTLKIEDGRIHGHSTDGVGLEYALSQEFGFTAANKRILFLGAGGACRATAFHFASKGAEKISIANRTLEKASELADEITSRTGTPACAYSINDDDSLRKLFLEADMVIQATSCGLKESDPSPVDPELITKDCHFDCFDTIYKETALLKAVKELGLRGAGGRQMLIGQGAASFRIWTGIEPDIKKMQSGFDDPISPEDSVC